MRLVIYAITAYLIYLIWATVTGRSINPFGSESKAKNLKERILLLLRGNEEAFLRMYEREKSYYPDMSETEILQRILDNLENDR